MKIAVIAANGRSGRAFVEAALSAGHEVNAGVLGSSLPEQPSLHIVRCDATKKEDLSKLIDGQDAVVSLIGHVKGSAADVQTTAMRKIVAVMKEKDTKRLVSLTGTGVRFKGDKITFIDRILNFGLRLADPNRLEDGINHAEVLDKSGLDWTLIRVLKLQNVAPGPHKLSEHGPTKPYVGREEVASAILEVLENGSFIKRAPIISPVD